MSVPPVLVMGDAGLGVQALLNKHLTSSELPKPLSAGPSIGLDSLLRCGDDAAKVLLTCVPPLLAAPETFGASLLAAIPCAVEASGLGKCLDDASNTQGEAVLRGQQECAAHSGTSIVGADNSVTCIVKEAE